MKISLKCCLVQTIKEDDFSHKTDYITEHFGHSESQRASTFNIGLKVTAILMNGWVLPICEVALERACA